MDSAFLQQFIDRFDTPGIDALVLMGSHARGTNQRYSDVDLARFTNFTYLLSMPSILAERFCHAAVSYTHLDVYKRQVHGKGVSVYRIWGWHRAD